MTGWSLDDVGVATIEVDRQCFPFDNPASCQKIGGTNVVFVGDANFIAGARPDVQAAYSTYPDNQRAGWGILVLTNFLPHVPNQQTIGGQGGITFYVYALDLDGHRTLLGRAVGDATPTSVTLNNDNIAQPFGNVDSPAQSATVSGSVPVFTWALTPDLNTVQDGTDILMPTNGTGQTLFIDSTPVGTMTYNQCRGDVGSPPPGGTYCDDDVANAFGNATPQPSLTHRTSNPTKFRNLDAGRGAIGALVLDTTTLTNGLRAISLSATDSNGRVSGIGSHFIIVANGGASEVGQDALAETLMAPARSRGPVSALDALPVSGRSVSTRAGYDLNAAGTALPPSSSGVRTVTVSPMGRVELWLATSVSAGYLISNDELHDLPVGSHLDLSTGVFAWAPPPGYFGTYHLVFIVGSERLLVDVVVQ